jgi:hypothetical protein
MIQADPAGLLEEGILPIRGKEIES